MSVNNEVLKDDWNNLISDTYKLKFDNQLELFTVIEYLISANSTEATRKVRKFIHYYLT